MLSLLSHWLGAWFALALPAFNTYKALEHGPPAQLELCAKYWVVVALFFALEQSLSAVLSWIPFYWELRTTFLLYTSFPGMQGATNVYDSLVGQWLSKNEPEIDNAISSAQSRVATLGRSCVSGLIDLVSNTPDASKQASPLAARVDQFKRLWAAYVPSVFAPLAPNGASDSHVHSTAKDRPQSYMTS